MIKTILHQSPALPSEGDCSIDIEVLFAGEKESKVTESFWCKKMSETTFRLCCIPFLLSAYSLGDIIEVKRKNDKFRIISLLELSNQITFRVWSTNTETKTEKVIRENLNGFNYLSEYFSDSNMTAVSVEENEAEKLEGALAKLKNIQADIDFNRTYRQENNISYKIHHKPAWREKADSIVNARIETSSEEVIYESLWAKQLQHNLYQVCCIPYFIYDLSIGDIFEADLGKRGGLVFKNVVESSGNETIWLHFHNALRDDLNNILKKIIEAECLYEGYNERFLALNISSKIQRDNVLKSLDKEIKAGTAQYSSNRKAV